MERKKKWREYTIIIIFANNVFVEIIKEFTECACMYIYVIRHSYSLHSIHKTAEYTRAT